MNITLNAAPFDKIDADAIAVLLRDGEDGPAELAGFAGWIAALKDSGEFTGKKNELSVLHAPQGLAAKRLVIVGGGKRDELDGQAFRRVVAAAVRTLKQKGVKSLAWKLEKTGDAEAAVEAALLGSFDPDKRKTSGQGKPLELFIVAGADTPAMQEAVRRGTILGESQNFTRELVNEPANILTPPELVRRAQAMAAECGLECEVLDRERMKQLGMGALLGVAQGSDEPPSLVILRYMPEEVPLTKDHLGLVGKGVTFDSGGISIKPAEGMEKMKYDMGGAGSMLGAMRAIAMLKPKIPVTALIATVENMVSGRAQRPGDIVTSLNGKTVEVLNTDAEGRLILIDALTYAQRIGCTHLIDAATLTGAVVVALGNVNIGVFSNNAAMRDRAMNAAKAEGEKAWELPMDEEYKELLKSSFADLANIGGRWGGSITAAWFLREFVGDTPWVHFDIAGTAWLDADKPFMAKGPTGVAVRTFTRVAMDW